MQSLSWYVRRLQAMSAQEIAWRAQSAVRGVTDRGRAGAEALSEDRRPCRAESPARGLGAALVSGSARRLDHARRPTIPRALWRTRLIDRADRVAAHHLSFFDLVDVNLGDPIDWHREFASGKATPIGYAESIDYRDYAVTGDCKVVWEPNRHHQLVILGRAYRATGDARYAAAVVEQIESWIEQNPFGHGMNWRSPLELAIRSSTGRGRST